MTNIINIFINETLEEDLKSKITFGYEEKKCANCDKLIKNNFSEFCLFHYKKKRFFCNQECLNNWLINYKKEQEEKNGKKEKEK